MKYYDGYKWNSNDSYVVNVKDFGAKGDGITDDSPAINLAMRFLESSGGGSMLFPAGNTYYMSPSVQLTSDIEIVGYGATIIKKSEGNYNSAAFIGPAGENLGYGGGVNNVVVRGLTFRGHFNIEDPYNTKGITSFSLHRAQNVLVEDCKFIEAQGRGHTFDLGGSRYITIKNCVWEGYDRQTFSGSAECIQLDQSRKGSVSTMPGAEVYDGTPTTDVIIENCKFLPYTKEGVTFPSPNPLGNHSTIENSPYRNVKFINNLIVDPWEDNSSSASGSSNGYRGIIHLIGTENVEISGNIFRSTKGKATRIIGMYGVSKGIPSNADFNSDVSQMGPISPTGLKNIAIRNNVFEGFLTNDLSEYGPNYSIIMYPIDSTTAIVENLDISGNYFRDRAVGTPDPIRIVGAKGVRVLGNSFDSDSTASPVVFTGNTEHIIVADNTYTNPTDLVNNAGTGVDVVVERNLKIT